MPMMEAKAEIWAAFDPLRGLLDALPKAVALQANPDDPALAEQAIQDGLDKVYLMLQAELMKE